MGCSGGVFDWEPALRRLDEFNARVEDPGFWNDADAAQTLMRKRTSLATQVDAVRRLERELADTLDFAELADAEGDQSSLDDAAAQLLALKELAARAELEALLSGEADGADAYLEVNSGAGGTESADWAAMLLRMYTRWATAHDMQVELIEETNGEQAGIKSATIKITGRNAYGWLKTEGGVHRLVRISPFDAAAKRHTSFASIWVFPVVDDKIEIEINPADVRTDTYRASGSGGQHVNKTDSAIRITHIPSGIVVECQDERSQHKNRSRALSLLKARLLAAEREKQQSQQAQSRKLQVGSGDRSERIRTYNFPQGRVTDHRINLTLYKLDEVMNGRIGELIAALNQEHQAEELAQQVE